MDAGVRNKAWSIATEETISVATTFGDLGRKTTLLGLAIGILSELKALLDSEEAAAEGKTVAGLSVTSWLRSGEPTHTSSPV